MATSGVLAGKGFEFAVLDAFRDALARDGVHVTVCDTAAYKTAASAFAALTGDVQADYKAAALAAFKVIAPLEPHLSTGSAALVLRIQDDGQGQKGDVRDVVCIRSAEGWEVGISCKHNHEALKHPRVTRAADFGAAWVGVPCSQTFCDAIARVMDVVEAWEGTAWREHPDKLEAVYRPVLEAYAAEVARLCNTSADVPARLVGYFFGVQDFYKVIAKDKRARGSAGMTKVMAFNLGGTLGQAAAGKRPLHKVRQIALPSRLIEVTMKKGSRTTLLLTFSDGWAISMRLHSADTLVKKTGLKWDVQLQGLPPEMLVQSQPW